MDEDEIVSSEVDVFYDYTIPADIGPDDLDAASNGSNLTTGLPAELSSDVTSQLTGDGATSIVTQIVDYLNSTLGIDLVSVLGTLVTIVAIIVLTVLAAPHGGSSHHRPHPKGDG
jgi:small conductance mechanosensitive channel